MAKKDERTKLVGEVFNGIKVSDFYFIFPSTLYCILYLFCTFSAMLCT